MIRASLSDRRREVTSCCRWLVSSGERPRARRTPTSPALDARRHSLSTSVGGRRRCHPSARGAFSRRAASSPMSTKPSYDFSERDEEEEKEDGERRRTEQLRKLGKIFSSYDDSDNLGNGGDGDDGSGRRLRWLERSTGLDDFPRFDNFHKYESPPAPPTSHAEEGSLLDLLNDETANGAHNDDPLERRGCEDASLLRLLNKDGGVDYSQKYPQDDHADYSQQYLQSSINGEGVGGDDGDLRQQQNDYPMERRGDEDTSLLRLLNKGDSVGYSQQYSESSYSGGGGGGDSHPQQQQNDHPMERRGDDDASLLELLSKDDLVDHSHQISQSFCNVVGDDKGGGGDSHLRHQQDIPTEQSLIDLLNGNANEFQSSFSGINGDVRLQYQPPEAAEDETESLHELLDEETKDVDKASKYRDLQRLQLQLETESTEESVQKVLDTWNSARDRSDYGTLPVVRRALDSWYGPLADVVELEQWLYLNGDTKTDSFSLAAGEEDRPPRDSGDSQDNGASKLKRTARDRTIYGPLLCLLPPRKIAVLLAHGALSLTLVEKDPGSKVVSLALYLAQILETEVNVSRALRVRAQEMRLKSSSDTGDGDGSSDDAGEETQGGTPGGKSETGAPSEGVSVESWVYTATHLQRFLDEISGGPLAGQKSLKGRGRVNPAKVQRRCREILTAEGFALDGPGEGTEGRKISMNGFEEWGPVKKVKLGAALIRLLLDHTSFSKPLRRGHAPPEPAFRFERKRHNGKKLQGYISVHPDLLNIAMKEGFSLSSPLIVPSKHFARVQPMVVPPKDWTKVDSGGYEMIQVPFMRTRHCKTQQDSIHKADLSKVMEGLNVLGNIPWRINKKVLDVALKCWENGIVLGDIPSQFDFEVPPLPEAVEYRDYNTLSDTDKKLHMEDVKKNKEALMRHKRFKQKNMDLHSLRCSAMLKLNQAKKFRDFEEIFFPYNVDFRGRAYPVTPHLTTVGSDLCRGLLMFSDSKPLGKKGLYWLKVHLANLAGADKMPFDGRAQFADDNIDNIRAAVNEPLGENDWWKKFDDPFQGLATCHEIVQAIDSGDPENFLCSLPVHMDGSCNGLQHYAALGRDEGGGKAVNLCVADKPQDVYSGVMHEVIRRVAQDAEEMIPFDEHKRDMTAAEKKILKRVKSARLVNGSIDRGVVKRTVMTSVYGVTFIGAQNQIREKIDEKLEEKGCDIDELEQEIHTACGYLAKITMEVIGQQFKGARQTMKWLTECARLISAQGQPVSFISPIGVPVVQPYRQHRQFAVITLLQRVSLTNDSDKMPLHRRRQVSAFPPNYVHSLDSSHMLLTAIEMHRRGLHFSAVHDSYWTHPCDVEEMNAVLREAFIELYNRPLLEELKSVWELRYPSINFPDIPAHGDLDLEDVRSAPYFFQ